MAAQRSKLKMRPSDPLQRSSKRRSGAKAEHKEGQRSKAQRHEPISAEARERFVRLAVRHGYGSELLRVARPVTRGTIEAVAPAALAGAGIGVAIGLSAEVGAIALPGLDFLFAGPFGCVALILGSLGLSIFGLIAALVNLRVERLDPADTAFAMPRVSHSLDPVDREAAALGSSVAWALTVLVSGLLLSIALLPWLNARSNAPAAVQDTRTSWTMPNATRFDGSSPEAVSKQVVSALGREPLGAPSDPIQAALLAPFAGRSGRAIRLGGGGAATGAELRALALKSDVIVVVSKRAPVYAMPAAYAAVQFGAAILTDQDAASLLEDLRGKRIFVAAPHLLIPDAVADKLKEFGEVRRVADLDPERHALAWARGRWGTFGWGIDERRGMGSYSFVLANPRDPAFAAAGLSLASSGRAGPLLYTERHRLSPLTAQFLWRMGPATVSGEALSGRRAVTVLGDQDQVAYAVQARANSALEPRPFLDRGPGLSGLAAIAWSWFFVGMAVAVWVVFAVPARLPETHAYARLLWPVACLLLGPVGLAAFLAAYQSRPISRDPRLPRFVRPRWVEAVSSTVLTTTAGLAWMLLCLALLHLNGLPPSALLGPYGLPAWVVSAIPATLISLLFFVGPIVALLRGEAYVVALRKALPQITVAVLAASAGLWLVGALWFVRLESVPHPADWVWMATTASGALIAYGLAYIPNFTLLREAWKNGGM